MFASAALSNKIAIPMRRSKKGQGVLSTGIEASNRHKKGDSCVGNLWDTDRSPSLQQKIWPKNCRRASLFSANTLVIGLSLTFTFGGRTSLCFVYLVQTKWSI